MLILWSVYSFFIFLVVQIGTKFPPEVLAIATPGILILFLLPVIPVVIRILERANFHYSFEDNYILLSQGIISKKNRSVPYLSIQGVFLRQGIFDKIFGIASLTFEDLSEGEIFTVGTDGYVTRFDSRREVVGFFGNKIHIPGLKKRDAQELKEILLGKIKEGTIKKSQSGL